MGCDVLTAQPTELDLKQGAIRFYAPGERPPWVSSAQKVLYEDRLGELAVSVKVDGKPYKLLVDTGADHSLLLGAPKAPGDAYAPGQDATGEVIDMWQGSGMLEVGNEIAARPLLKAPSWPYFKGTLDALGGGLSGLLGLSSIPGQKLFIDAASRTLAFPG